MTDTANSLVKLALPARAEDANRRLLPKTVQLDNDLPDRMSDMWRKFVRICGDSQCITDDRASLTFDRLRNEHEVTWYLHVYLVDPLRRCFDGLIHRANTTPPASSHPDDQRLLRALRMATSTAVMHQDNRFIIDTPYHDAATYAASRLDAGILADELTRNVSAHSVASEAPAPAGSSPVPPTTAEQQDVLLHLPFGKRTPDISLCWYPVQQDYGADDGVPFFTVEVKDPKRISYDDVIRCVTRFDGSIVKDRPKFAKDIQDFQRDGTMNIRFLLNREVSPFNSLANGFWDAIGRYYQSMFTGRQTFGGFKTGMMGIGLRIDWDHPTEPG